jgi:hypothetical protein
MRKLIPWLMLFLTTGAIWSPDTFGSIRERRVARHRANQSSQAVTTNTNRCKESWIIALDEFGCNGNLCNTDNPCNRGCKCRYPSGATIGYCVPWYTSSQGMSSDEKEYIYKNNTEFMVAMTIAIVSDWNKKALLDNASPEFLASLKNQDLDGTFSEYRKLGKVQMRKDAKISPISKTIDGNIVSFTAKMDFDAGPVEVKMSLVESDSNKWQIKNFNIAPSHSTENTANRTNN